MPKNSRVSAVVTAFQCEAFLAESLASVLGQTHPLEEVIVVDDGSTDGTAEVARSFGGLVRVVSRPNGGPGAARNTGLAEARGDWIAFLDGDDAWTPDKTRLQLEAAAKAPSASLVFGHASNVVAPRGVGLADAHARATP
ncbi:MAG: glycosyltransferase, partial [Thermoanaerobaculia bacterium]|nr:glycosyltransferase [Thermoanaerobaculia bacterium]